MSLVLPVLILAAVAWAVPWLLAKVVPEGVGWLFMNGVCSSVLLALIAGAGFVVLYGEAGGVVWREAPWHFAVLSLRSALIWGPVMVLSLANLPRKWKDVVW